jgi:hypothetical protein
MKLLKRQHFLILITPVIAFLVGCPGGSSMSGNQFRNTMRAGTAGESAEVQRRVARGTNDYRNIDPSGIVNSFVEPCTSCDNHVQNGREVPISNTRLARNFQSMGGSPKALAHALCFMDRHENTSFAGGTGRTSIKDKCKLAINDHAGKGVRENKMFIVNRCTGEVKVTNVARGSRGIGQGTGKTNPGFHISGGWHAPYPVGHHKYKRWYPGIKMVGLQEGVNDEAWGRGVVMHRAVSSRGDYCSGGMNSSNQTSGTVSGDCGRSSGCPAVDPSSWQTVVNDLKGDDTGGSLIYNYTNREAGKGADYCGDRLKIVGAR